VALVASCALVVFFAASASAAKQASPSGEVATSGSWGGGIEAALPADATESLQLASVSCPSAGNCSAVGQYDRAPYWANNRDAEGLLLTETAGRWDAGLEAALPANAANEPQVSIRSVSCPSVGNCSAVGSYTVLGGTEEGLLLTETAGVWAPGVEAALPASSQGTANLTSVSCASPGNCAAVGDYSLPGPAGEVQGLLVTETAGSWSTGVEAMLPANATTPQQEVKLASVSCGSPGNCSAVGSYLASSGEEGLLLTETAGSWGTGVEAVLPADAATAGQEAFLSSVSCPSAGNCSAVGLYDDFLIASGPPPNLQISVGRGLLLTETGGSWAPGVEAAPPADAQTPESLTSLSSVSCPSAGNCSAVGTYLVDSSGPQGLLLTETAGSWAAGTEALPANAVGTGQEWDDALSWGVGLQSVSCPSAGNCSAVGGHWDSSGSVEGLLLTQSAGSWETGQLASLPANANPHNPYAALYSVSCASAGNCSAGGNYLDSSNGDGGNGAGLLIGGSPPFVTLDISKSGTGSGRVSSAPTGISCGSTCSASFEAGTLLTLTATPSPGSKFTGWSGGGLGCLGLGTCQPNTGISDQTVTATFNLLPKCAVPKLQGKTLGAAKRAIRIHHCALGKIKHATSRTIKKGRVISQKPRQGRRLQHGARVSLLVSKGAR
jgi:Divergent InlB B-repeat domain/PASTA domain